MPKFARKTSCAIATYFSPLPMDFWPLEIRGVSRQESRQVHGSRPRSKASTAIDVRFGLGRRRQRGRRLRRAYGVPNQQRRPANQQAVGDIEDGPVDDPVNLEMQPIADRVHLVAALVQQSVVPDSPGSPSRSYKLPRIPPVISARATVNSRSCAAPARTASKRCPAAATIDIRLNSTPWPCPKPNRAPSLRLVVKPKTPSTSRISSCSREGMPSRSKIQCLLARSTAAARGNYAAEQQIAARGHRPLEGHIRAVGHVAARVRPLGFVSAADGPIV